MNRLADVLIGVCVGLVIGAVAYAQSGPAYPLSSPSFIMAGGKDDSGSAHPLRFDSEGRVYAHCVP